MQAINQKKNLSTQLNFCVVTILSKYTFTFNHFKSMSKVNLDKISSDRPSSPRYFQDFLSEFCIGRYPSKKCFGKNHFLENWNILPQHKLYYQPLWDLLNMLKIRYYTMKYHKDVWNIFSFNWNLKEQTYFPMNHL